MRLLRDATTDGDGDIINLSRAIRKPATLHIVGTWDGASVAITGSIDEGVTFLAPRDSVSIFTTDTLINLDMGAGKIKATISNAGGSTDLNAYLSY